MPGLWSVPVAVIFAREFLEAMVIIGNYRSLVIRSEQYPPDAKKRALRDIWIFAALGFIVAVIVIVCVGIPLGVLGNKLDNEPAIIIEGVSKLVACVCILALSLKIPKWMELGPYGVLAARKKVSDSLHQLRFDVAWNIWREMAEIGIFLVPFFLAKNELDAIGPSALAGIAIALAVGIVLHIISRFTTKRLWLAILMCGLTQALAGGLFIGGMHEFEEIREETEGVDLVYVFFMPGCAPTDPKGACQFWDHKKLPMALLRPFGYEKNPTIVTFPGYWLFAAFACLCHFLKYKYACYKVKKLAEGQEPVSIKSKLLRPLKMVVQRLWGRKAASSPEPEKPATGPTEAAI